jgi:uncharacterized membrane protein
MLVVFPISLWVFSLVCDLIGMSVATTFTVALYTMVGSLIGALAAAVPGLIDLLYYKGGAPPVKKIALTHMTINLVFVVLDAVNIWRRTSGQENMKVHCPFDHRRMHDRGVGVARYQIVHVYGVGVEGRE